MSLLQVKPFDPLTTTHRWVFIGVDVYPEEEKEGLAGTGWLTRAGPEVQEGVGWEARLLDQDRRVRAVLVQPGFRSEAHVSERVAQLSGQLSCTPLLSRACAHTD